MDLSLPRQPSLLFFVVTTILSPWYGNGIWAWIITCLLLIAFGLCWHPELRAWRGRVEIVTFLSFLFKLFRCLAVLLLLQHLLGKAFPSRQDPGFSTVPKYQLVPASDTYPEPTEYGVDIIFVHGLGSNPDTTWTRMNQSCINLSPCNSTQDPHRSCSCSVNWITDFLHQDLEPFMQRYVRLYFYNYDSYWMHDASLQRLEDYGKGLFEDLTSLAKQSKKRNFILLGHSYGGLVNKQREEDADSRFQALVKANEMSRHRSVDVFKQTRAIVNLGVPHGGSHSAWIGFILAHLLRFLGFDAAPDLVYVTSYENDRLFDLQEAFGHVWHPRPVTNFYETKLTKSLFGFWTDNTVTIRSASMGGLGTVNQALSTDHMGLNKFSDRNSNYLRIRDALVDCIQDIMIETKFDTRIFAIPAQRRIPPLHVMRSSLAEELETQIRTPLPRNNNIGRQTKHALLIEGLGGSGKTDLAIQYVEQQRNVGVYDIFLWVDCTSEKTIRQGFHSAAEALHLECQVTDEHTLLSQDCAVSKVLAWLENRRDVHGEWLVVLDNADNLNTGLRDIIPHGQRGTIIITSRNARAHDLLPHGSQRLNVGILEPAEAQSLLLQHLHLDSASIPEDIKELSLNISDNMAYLVLAVNLAGANIRARNRLNYPVSSGKARASLAAYLRDFKRHKDALLRDGAGDGHNVTIATIWHTSFEAIERQYPQYQPKALLVLLARLSLEQAVIDKAMLSLVAGGLRKVPEVLVQQFDLPTWVIEMLKWDPDGMRWDDFVYTSTLTPLLDNHLVSEARSGFGVPGVTMHPLVQWAATRIDETRAPGTYQTIISALFEHVSFHKAALMPYIFNAERVLKHGAPRSESFYNELHLRIATEATLYLHMQYDVQETAVK